MARVDALAYWIEAPFQGALRRETLPPLGPADVQVRALHGAISRGTELLVYRGQVPASEYDRMRAPFQCGDFPAPVKYGYSSVGVVEHGPAHLQGQTVFCLHPHQSRYVVPASAVHPVPAGVPAARAVLAANLETAVNAIWDSEAKPGDRIAVVGAGTVGVLVAWLAAGIRGCQVQLIDVRPERAAVATRLGTAFASAEHASGGADIVFHSSGSAAGLRLALRLAAFEAQVIELSWYGTTEVTIALGEAFHSRRLTLRSSQVGAVAASQRARWSSARRMAFALGLLAEPALDALISGDHRFADLPGLMQALDRGDGAGLCERLNYD